MLHQLNAIMLLNPEPISRLAADSTFTSRCTGKLYQCVQQTGKWELKVAVLKGNLLFLQKTIKDATPEQMLIIEDCRVDLCDEQQADKAFAFEIRYQTSENSYRFAAESLKDLEKWVTMLVSCSSNHVRLAKELYEEQQKQHVSTLSVTDGDVCDNDLRMSNNRN